MTKQKQAKKGTSYRYDGAELDKLKAVAEKLDTTVTNILNTLIKEYNDKFYTKKIAHLDIIDFHKDIPFQNRHPTEEEITLIANYVTAESIKDELNIPRLSAINPINEKTIEAYRKETFNNLYTLISLTGNVHDFGTKSDKVFRYTYYNYDTNTSDQDMYFLHITYRLNADYTLIEEISDYDFIKHFNLF